MKKIIVIAIILSGLALLSFLVYWFFFSTEAINVVPEININTDRPAEQPGGQSQEAKGAAKKEPVRISFDTGQNNAEAAADTAEVTSFDLEQIALSFAERFGSYSNQSDYNNINDLKIFMSDRMKKWSDDYIAQQRSRGSSNEIYFGITTKAVNTRVEEFDDDIGTATIIVSVRRREATGSTNNTSRVFNQDIAIEFTKERGTWKVDEARWR